MDFSTLKTQYIRTLPGARARESCTRAFRCARPWEEQFGIDCSQASREENNEIVAGVLEKAQFRGWEFTYHLYLYDQWCVSNGFARSSPFSGFQHPEIDRIIRQYVSSPQDLQVVLDSILTDERKNTIDNVLRAYCWLGFMGLNGYDAINVKKEDVDMGAMAVSVNGNAYKIPREAAYAFQSVLSLDQFFYIHPNASGTGPYAVWRDRVASDLILRGFRVLKNEFFNPKTYLDDRLRLLALAKERKASVPRKITYLTARQSGAFYRAYLDEAEIGTVTPRQLFMLVFPEKDNVNNSTANRMMNLYHIWKLSFYADLK